MTALLALAVARLADPFLLLPLAVCWWLWLGRSGPGFWPAMGRIAIVALIVAAIGEVILHGSQLARTGRHSVTAVAVTLCVALAASAIVYGVIRLFRR